MINGLTSIILSCKIRTKTECHMTMAALANIVRYSDTLEYELIVVDPFPIVWPIRDDYKNLNITKHLQPDPDPGYTACMNLGVREAQGEYLCFIQNDVFVFEGWLKNLRWYLENKKCDCIIPDQVPRDRQFVLDSYEMSMEKGMEYHSRDEGLWMMTRQAFDRFGGFNEELSLLHARDFYARCKERGIVIHDTCKVMISHIMGATNWQLHDDDYLEYTRRMNNDTKKLNV